MNSTTHHRSALALWLLSCCVMVFAMVILGGVTRLTGSGLSMVEWDPFFGVVPPLNEAEWEEVFLKYQASPEYQKINVGMDLEGFKAIYWFEFAHRILGRAIGIVFLLPFLFFWLSRRIPKGYTIKFATMFLLGGLQGLLGWYMVKSGLVDNPHVSQYRLTAHLGLAFIIFGYMFWVALDLLFPRTAYSPPAQHRGLRRAALGLAALVFVTILSGGFVAGLKAGFAYNTFPLMDGHWVPETMWLQSPWWRNLFENIATVQFDHRLLAVLVLVSTLLLWAWASRQALHGRSRLGLHLLLAVVCLQVALGISTLLLHVPVALGAAHQGGALLVLTLVIFFNHALRSPAAVADPKALGATQGVGGI
jgi:cytochrome c oxidase assembly protein subunit 15